ncbi:hypothetical protein ACSU64_15915 [Bacillaceae bacterium C204]|uniref:hypothetical protein n=1 Tax=Neobacillus sp. 204 TaxID=3383351 RepID=UPI00397B4EF7
MFNEYSVYQMMKLRQEETERNAREAWKFIDLKSQSFLQKIIRKFTNTKNAKTELNNQNNCACTCGC